MDVMWLRNPFVKLSENQTDDLQISCDEFNGHPESKDNLINTGFYFVRSNNKTIALFDSWYDMKDSSPGMKEQDVLIKMMHMGMLEQLGLIVLYFSGFCRESRDFNEVTTVHANCCRRMKAKSETIMNTVGRKDELEMALARASMVKYNKTVIIAIINKAYADGGIKGKTMLELFLEGFWVGEDTRDLVDHLLLVAMDQIAFDKCKFMKLHCYKLETEGVDYGGEKLFMSQEFIKMMWRRTLFLGDVLKRGYSFIFTDMDVMWLRNPFVRLSQNQSEDLQISCDNFNGNPESKDNYINTGFYFVRSNNKTISLFDSWYAMKDNSTGIKEQDVLIKLMYMGMFEELGLRVRILDTLYFSGFCRDSSDFNEVTIVHATCCRSMNAKVIDLMATLQDWTKYKGLTNYNTSILKWSPHSACSKSWID
ncbi:uncharacterized protein At1g28695-like [Telopea speciosissima]|uniref:uncharacterized protein At1g28695-like n=1 Tax=Telopea speciosissima TaxID=54955 RepID=UPI001CC3FC33|nr:uncharacterized protein At1g28695-like [Telopea speciosissima]